MYWWISFIFSSSVGVKDLLKHIPLDLISISLLGLEVATILIQGGNWAINFFSTVKTVTDNGVSFLKSSASSIESRIIK